MANEKRLIDGNKAQAVLVNMAEHLMEAGNPEMAGAVGYAAEIIGKQRTVDAVEVVRCKDCKHYDNSEGICWRKLNSKFFPGGFDWHGFPEDGFCSYGERKDNG